MKHPFQLVATDKENELLFTASKQTLQIFDLKTKALVKSWTDELDSTYILKKQQQEKIDKLKEQGIEKVPKVPKPGETAPKINNFIRNLLVNDKYVVLTTDTDKACVIFKRSQDEIITLFKRVELPKRPCSIVIDAAQDNLILGDKFGDVYKISLTDPEEESTKDLSPILGHVSMLTSVNHFVKDHKEFLITTDRDEHIKISNYPKAYIIETFLFEHMNFISTTLVTSDLKLLTGGGDDFVCLWDLQSYQLIEKINLREYFAEDEIAVFTLLKIVQYREFFVIAFESFDTLLVVDSKLKSVVKLKFTSRVIDLTSNDHQLIASLESKAVALVTLVNGEFQTVDDEAFIAKSTVEVADESEIIPLFPLGNLRKHSERGCYYY